MGDVDNLNRRQRYLESGVWKCPDSPTGAHHWVGISDLNEFKCKHCGEEKQFEVEGGSIIYVTKKQKARKEY